MNTKQNVTEKKPSEITVCSIDNAGEVVKRVYYKSRDYVVYRTDTAIRIDFDNESENLENFRKYHGRISVELARIYSWLPEKLTWSEPINRQIARSIAENAMGNTDEAKKMLTHAERRIKSIKTINGRLQYTISSFAVMGVCLILMMGMGSVSPGDGDVISAYYLYTKIAFCGALGGILSVSLGFPKLEIDIDANILTNCLIGASRIIISIAAALFSYFAIKSGVAFSFLSNDGSTYGVYVAAMTAGFSEMLVPNIMSNYSNNTNDKNSLPE